MSPRARAFPWNSREYILWFITLFASKYLEDADIVTHPAGFFQILVYILTIMHVLASLRRISDRENQKKRLHFSTVYKGLSVNLFHAKIPLTGLKNNVSKFVAKPTLTLYNFKPCPFHIALLNPLAVLFSYPCNRSILLSVSPQWAMLFIDLESLAGELFKGISTLDAISLFASCQIRRIFTMKPAAAADGNGKRQTAPRFRWMSVLCFLMMSLPEGSMAGSIPCSYQFPPDVHYTTCVLNMKNLQRGKISKNITLSLLKRLEGTWRVM